jgi:hypothetical protein
MVLINNQFKLFTLNPTNIKIQSFHFHILIGVSEPILSLEIGEFIHPKNIFFRLGKPEIF